MCRLFALRANEPTRAEGSLLLAPHSLSRQSLCDARSLSHDNGWGIGYYVDGQARRVRSERSAHDDPRFRETAERVVTTALLAHIRRASMGAVAVRNSHPFLQGRWLFAHNGTLFGFSQMRERLLQRIPAHLRGCIEGDTDSEHAFYLLLGRLEAVAGGLSGPVKAEAACEALADTLDTLEDLCPGQGDERSQFNFVLTDGRLLVASRWRHSLWWLERRGPGLHFPDRPAASRPDYHAVAIASEPTTDEAWTEIPDRALFCMRADLSHYIHTIG